MLVTGGPQHYLWMGADFDTSGFKYEVKIERSTPDAEIVMWATQKVLHGDLQSNPSVGDSLPIPPTSLLLER